MTSTATSPAPAAIEDAPAAAAPFGMPPRHVLRDASLSMQARTLYCILDDRQGASGSLRVRIETLCEDTGASSASVRRWLDELRAAGLLATQQTGRSLAIHVSNPSRRPRRVLTGEHSECSPVSALQRKNSQERTTPPDCQPTDRPPARPRPRGDGQTGTQNPGQTDHQTGTQNPGQTDQRTDPDREYLAAIEDATGHPLRPTTAVRAHLAAIRRSGTTPADTAALAAAYLAANGATVRQPSAWLAAFALPAIAEGNRPEQPHTTYAPPTYMSQLATEPCDHGDPRGPAYCALCRHGHP